MNGFAAHFRQPVIVFLSANWIRMTDEMYFVFVEEVWDGIEPFIEHFDLNIIHVVASSAKINAFADFIRLLGKGRNMKDQAEEGK